MAEKILTGRIVQKHDVESNWLKATNFTPKQGEVIIYDIDENYSYERIKIGDGVQNVNDLPFVNDALRTELLAQINSANTNIDTVDDKVDAVSALVGDTSVSTQITTAMADKMDMANPTGTGAFSLNRKSGTTVGNYSVAIGQNTTASGTYSFAEGSQTVASVHGAHAEGYGTEAHAQYAHTEGVYTIANSPASHVQGMYNIADATQTYAHIVGNGTGVNARSNAHTVAWTGDAWFKGDVYVGGTDQSTGEKLAKQSSLDTLVGDTSVAEQIAAAQMVYVGPDEPTDPNIKVWINTSEEGTGVIPVLPRVATITLAADSWSGSSDPYSQSVEIATVTTASKVDLQPTAQQIVSLQNAEISLMIENNGGVLTCYAIGNKPTVDYTMQVLIQEVSYV